MCAEFWDPRMSLRLGASFHFLPKVSLFALPVDIVWTSGENGTLFGAVVSIVDVTADCLSEKKPE